MRSIYNPSSTLFAVTTKTKCLHHDDCLLKALIRKDVMRECRGVIRQKRDLRSYQIYPESEYELILVVFRSGSRSSGFFLTSKILNAKYKISATT